MMDDGDDKLIITMMMIVNMMDGDNTDRE